MSKQELASKVKELKELKLMAEELQGEITAIEDSLKSVMTSQNTEEMTVDVFKVKYTQVTSKRFDTTLFKEKYTDLYNQFVKQTISRRFSIV